MRQGLTLVVIGGGIVAGGDRLAARRIPIDVSYTWVPRERNTAADRLVNEALDAQAAGGCSAHDLS